MPLAVKPTIQRVIGRLPVYRTLPDGALRTYAALRYHGQHSSQDEITRYLRSIDGIPTRWLSTAMVAARAAFLTGQDDLLQETLATLEQRFPESSRLYVLRADLQTYHGQYRQALGSAHRSRLLKPSYPRATARVVALSYRLLDPAEADQVAVAAIRRFPRTSEVLWAVAHTCATPEQFHRLHAGWRDRADPPDLLRAVRQLATAAARAGEVVAATDLYRQGIQLLAEGGHPAPTIAETRLEGRGAGTAIRDLQQALDGAGVPFFFAAGTALGLVREGRPLGADGDIDVGILDPDWDREALVDLFTRHPRFDFQPDHPRSKKLGLRHRGGAPVDLFRFYPDADRVWHDAVFVRWHNTPFQVRRQQVDGVAVPLPADPDRYLTENYGDWRTSNPAFDAFTDDAPNVATTWPEYAQLHLVRRAFKRLAIGDWTGAGTELRRAGEGDLAARIGRDA
ncbi:MAG: hypothetical protein GEV12_09400 [Micromonosporaceae bacterium]|nr:hypothetical protein [Micromonosporaceae bacterium]